MRAPAVIDGQLGLLDELEAPTFPSFEVKVASATIPPAGDGLDDLGPERPDELLIGAVGQQAARCRCEPGPVVDTSDPSYPCCVRCGRRVAIA